MANPALLSRKLRDTLGPDSGEDLMTWLQEARNDVAQLRNEFGQLRNEFGQLRNEFAQSRVELLDAIRASEARMVERMHALGLGLGKVEVRVAEVKSDLMKWSFVFWVSAVAAIAALAGVLR